MRRLSLEDCAALLRDGSAAMPNGCVEWQRGTTSKGYGVVAHNRRTHRVAYELAKGPIPSGGHVLHRCDNRRCVNPEHLFLGTNEDNIADKVAKDRASKRLTRERAQEVIEMVRSGMTQRCVALAAGITQGTVSRLVRGERRPYLKGGF